MDWRIGSTLWKNTCPAWLRELAMDIDTNAETGHSKCSLCCSKDACRRKESVLDDRLVGQRGHPQDVTQTRVQIALTIPGTNQKKIPRATMGPLIAHPGTKRGYIRISNL